MISAIASAMLTARINFRNSRPSIMRPRLRDGDEETRPLLDQMRRVADSFIQRHPRRLELDDPIEQPPLRFAHIRRTGPDDAHAFHAHFPANPRHSDRRLPAEA